MVIKKGECMVHGSILAKITFFISSYKIVFNDSNEHDCYFLK